MRNIPSLTVIDVNVGGTTNSFSPKTVHTNSDPSLQSYSRALLGWIPVLQSTFLFSLVAYPLLFLSARVLAPVNI